MTRIIATITAITLGFAALPASASGGLLDRVEDRIDRRESIRDERVDRGPLDVIEDRLDRIESVRDRAGFERPTPVDRWERRKLRRIWHRNNDE